MIYKVLLDTPVASDYVPAASFWSRRPSCSCAWGSGTPAYVWKARLRYFMVVTSSHLCSSLTWSTSASPWSKQLRRRSEGPCPSAAPPGTLCSWWSSCLTWLWPWSSPTWYPCPWCDTYNGTCVFDVHKQTIRRLKKEVCPKSTITLPWLR